MKKNALLFFCLLITFQALPQVKLNTLSGSVIDDEGKPIGFVSLSLLHDASVGTYTNAEGKFQFRVPLINSDDSVLFSCIGYENGRASIFDLAKNDSVIVILKLKAYVLNEIVILPDTAKEIVKRSVRMLQNNLAGDKNILQGFYRETIRSDHTYDRLIEAAVDVFDKGYKENSDNALQFKIREIRKSNDYRDLDWKQSILEYITPMNGLHGDHESLFFNNYIRNNKAYFNILTNAPIGNEKFYNETLFQVDSVLYLASDKILRITIRPTDESLELLPYGTLYIRERDYAILEMHFETQVAPELRSELAVPGKEFMHQTVIKYKEYFGNWYLSFIHRVSYRADANWTKYSKAKEVGKIEGLFYNDYLFITNQIITERAKLHAFKRKERQQKDVDLYSNDSKYNEAFWKTYNVVNEKPLEPNVKKDIEREIKLDEQFKNN